MTSWCGTLSLAFQSGHKSSKVISLLNKAHATRAMQKRCGLWLVPLWLFWGRYTDLGGLKLFIQYSLYQRCSLSAVRTFIRDSYWFLKGPEGHIPSYAFLSQSMDWEQRDNGRLRRSEKLARMRWKTKRTNAVRGKPVAWSWFPGPAEGGGAEPRWEPEPGLLDQVLLQNSLLSWVKLAPALMGRM